MEKPNVLYISMLERSPSHRSKLAGIRRYCSMRGWEAVPVPRRAVSAASIPGLLATHRPVGCVVDGIGRHGDLPPNLFGDVPVSYIGYPSRMNGKRPNFVFDPDAISKAALRELSAGRPPCYAAVGSMVPLKWSRNRVRAFRATVAAAGAKCLAFPSLPHFEPESADLFVARLTPWLTRLPRHCAVFAVSDETAVLVTRAARAAKREIPRSLTLLSVDNFADLCESADPPISSIQLDFEREGFIATQALEASDMAEPPIGPLLVVRRKSTSGHGRNEKFVIQALEAIRREACDGLSARALAARFPSSRRLFEMRFREATGHSVLDEIIHVRLEKACALLARTDTAVSAVPGLCGFSCDRTLDAIFRSRFGLSMRDWRKRNR